MGLRITTTKAFVLLYSSEQLFAVELPGVVKGRMRGCDWSGRIRLRCNDAQREGRHRHEPVTALLAALRYMLKLRIARRSIWLNDECRKLLCWAFPPVYYSLLTVRWT